MGPTVGKISFPKEMCEPWREWATEWLDGFDTAVEIPGQHCFRREKGFINSDDKRLVNLTMSSGDALFTVSRLLHRPTVNAGEVPVPTSELFFAKLDAALERITMPGTSWLVCIA
ncbi:hypothetical protein FOZ63_011255 [Perkinsus olseni]|uniref:Uncharacterized protein n=1 Tax=Perkinsus olseni TaxID=32597 RepID=A0A7J6TPE2_PEROL|nr:hypothetical protein FOZ60_015963 [Perkinsus olseni]KAF4746791.1 hypothetical protein FOZ63_011255 [Perkinsus olseni]